LEEGTITPLPLDQFPGARSFPGEFLLSALIVGPKK
jgi:hypothetical protein